MQPCAHSFALTQESMSVNGWSARDYVLWAPHGATGATHSSLARISLGNQSVPDDERDGYIESRVALEESHVLGGPCPRGLLIAYAPGAESPAAYGAAYTAAHALWLRSAITCSHTVATSLVCLESRVSARVVNRRAAFWPLLFLQRWAFVLHARSLITSGECIGDVT